MKIAKVFWSGQSQAIRLPKDFWVEGDEVYLKRTREGFLVIVKEPWEVFLEGVQEISDDFMSGVRVQPNLETRVME